MAGAFKKTMIYLGLADADEHDDSFTSDQPNRSSPDAAAEPKRSAAGREPAVEQRAAAAQPVSVRAESGATVQGRTGEVVSLNAHGAKQPGAAASAPASEYTSGNLAVDPDYRATVTPIKRASSSRDENSAMRKITTVHPRSYNDAKVIGESFRESIPVIMNVTDMGEAEAKRLVDFSAGLVFGLGGSIERVTNKVFLLTPNNIEVLAEERSAADTPAAAQFFNQS